RRRQICAVAPLSNSRAGGGRRVAIKGGMRAIMLLIAVGALSLASSSAEQVRPLKFDNANKGKLEPARAPKRGTSCAASGAGFVRDEGTGTCMKIGGASSVGGGIGGR